MSLVNDALKKARMEAARGDAAKRGIPYPSLGTERRTSDGKGWVVGAAVALVLIAALGGFLLFTAGKQSALDEPTLAQAGVARPAEASASEAGAAPGQNGLAAGRDPAAASDEGSGSSPAREGSSVSGSVPPPPTRRQEVRAAEPAPVRSRAEVEPAPARTLPPSAESQEARVAEPTPGPRPELRRSSPPPADAGPALPSEPAARTPARPEAIVDPAPPAERPAPSRPEQGRPELIETPRTAAPPDEPADEAPAREFLRRANLEGIGEIELGGIAWSGDRPFALVNGRVVRPGDSVEGLMIEDIQRNTVRLRGDDGALIFRLK